ncbi:hypothetical protein SCLARK_001474 [Spiroplasma clarkii]|uniref:Lipoprotein n=1 Tax=Spiroplasma clarkii TaxID=2139 RepID=A0A1Y0L1W0_9MOLU|nr:lipoprotein [Spiroplasma clarkii]ARU91991.1 hypothetical protein SCLARK_001474 [Spiroplasma clarkii]ATX71329.1 hypothetical protein SCLAR_v1c10290 [Spiroplasma clarkii]
MRKILSILGAISVSTIGVVNVVSCTPRGYIPKEEEEIPEVKELAKFDSFTDFLKMQMEKSEIFYDLKDLYQLPSRKGWLESDKDENISNFWKGISYNMQYRTASTLSYARSMFERDYNEDKTVNDWIFKDKDGDETFSYLKSQFPTSSVSSIFENYTLIYPKIRYESKGEDDEWILEDNDNTKFNGMVVDETQRTYDIFIQKGYVEIKVLESSIFWNLKPNENGYESFFITEKGVLNENGYSIWLDREKIPTSEIGQDD